MQTFQLQTQLTFGDHALDALRELQGSRFFVVTDPFFQKNGLAQQVATSCKGDSYIFSRVQPDPSLSLVAEGLKELLDFRGDTLIALGGGSAIDCAKGILSMCPNRPYFVAIPTTSGTGSEVTSFAILTHQGVKHPLVEAHIRPDLAILDDSLLGNLPQSLIADGGMDALSHCAEALVAKNSSPFTQALAVSAFQTLTELLPQSYEGDSSVRGKLHCAATMAGIAFDHSGLGICHSLSHALGGRFHVPHGRLNAILLPHVIGFNRSHCSYLPLGTNVVFGLSRLRRRLGLPQSLKEVGISREALHTALEDLAIATLEDPCTATNPRPVTLEDCKTLLKECL